MLAEDDHAALERELGPYRVGPGDVLGVLVLGPMAAPEVAPGAPAGVTAGLPVRVDRKGEIRLPNVGTIKVAGLELEDVEARIHEAYITRQIYTDPNQVSVNVTVTSPEMTNVLVTGAAITPGVIQLRRTQRNLLYAVAAAGGMTQIASGDVTVKRLRQPTEEVTYNLYDPEQLRASLAAPPLEHGDIVEVCAAPPNIVFVGGMVMTPGPQTYLPGTHVSVLQVLAAANGTRQDLISVHKATLIRRLNGHDVHVKLDLNRIQAAKDPNIKLAAGDILWVPSTISSRIEDWMNRNLFLRAGATATYGLSYDMPGVDYLNRAAAQQFSNFNNGGLQDQFDPFGFLLRNQALSNLQGAGT
jgi:protein involved in polysaccharide export with SLBB domain